MPQHALFKRPPRTEQDVVVLFGTLLPYLDEPLMVERVQTGFPDCTLVNRATGEKLRAEFEWLASNFKTHRHDPSKCDVIICWRDDVKNWPAGLKVWELRELVQAKCPWMIEELTESAPTDHWDKKSFLEQAALDKVASADVERLQQLLEKAAASGLGIQWQAAGWATFTVGADTQYFKVRSDGQLVFPFSRLNAGDLFPELARRLNEAFNQSLIGPNDANTKSIGGRVSELFPTEHAIDEFLAVWKWFANAAHQDQG